MKYVFRLLLVLMHLVGKTVHYPITFIINILIFIWCLDFKHFIGYDWIDWEFKEQVYSDHYITKDEKKTVFYDGIYDYLTDTKTTQLYQKNSNNEWVLFSEETK